MNSQVFITTSKCRIVVLVYLLPHKSYVYRQIREQEKAHKVTLAVIEGRFIAPDVIKQPKCISINSIKDCPSTSLNCSPCKMSSDKNFTTKSNRISDDSGVVCFNTTDDLLNASSSSVVHNSLSTDSISSASYTSAMSSCNSFSSASSAMFLLTERQDHNDRVEQSLNSSPGDSLGSDLSLQYKSVYSRNTSFEAPNTIITCTPSAIKRREKRGNHLVGTGSLEETVAEENVGKYGSKRLTHVQQMRMRFENWCHLNEQKKRCEAIHCKGSIREEVQFDSLPIIPFKKSGSDKKTSTVESPSSPELIAGVIATEEDDDKSEEVDSSNPEQASLDCACGDDDGDKDEIEFREIGKLGIWR